MPKIHLIATVLASTFFFVGCSQKITGEAFYKDGDKVMPLADMEIRVVSQASFNEHLLKMEPVRTSEISRLKTEIEESQASVAKLNDLKRQVSVLRKQLVDRAKFADEKTQIKIRTVLLESDHEVAVASREIIRDTKKIAENTAELDSLTNHKNGKFLFPFTNVDAVVSTRTASNGSFELNHKTFDQTVAVATDGKRFWLISLNGKTSKVSFTDSSANGVSCDICIPQTK